MMVTRKIRKNATKKIKNILSNAKKIKYFNHSNDYNGEYGELPSDKKINATIEDIELGHANMFELADGNYMIRYARPCKWIIEMK